MSEAQTDPALLVVMVVTKRPDLKRRVRSVSAALSRRDILVDSAPDLEEALGALSAVDNAVLVFDSSSDPGQIGSVPRLLTAVNTAFLAVLIAENHDEMLRRSAIRTGYADCVGLDVAMRADYLGTLSNLPPPSEPTEAPLPDLEARFGSIQDSILVVEPSGRIVYANPLFFSAVGLLPSDITGLGFSAFFPELGPSFLEHNPAGCACLLELRRASGNVEVVEAAFSPAGSDVRPLLAIRF